MKFLVFKVQKAVSCAHGLVSEQGFLILKQDYEKVQSYRQKSAVADVTVRSDRKQMGI